MNSSTLNDTTDVSRSIPDAISLLEADHRAVEELFVAFENAEGDSRKRGTIVRRACEMLTVHAMLEEEIFYPAARAALKEEGASDVDEAYVEHFLVKSLIDKFASMKPRDEGFDAAFKVMSELVRHHVEEEEGELFPDVEKTGIDLDELGSRLAASKAELTAKLPNDAGDPT